MKMELSIRFDYGSVVPWVRRTEDGLSAIAGPDTVRLRTPVDLKGENFKTTSEFTVSAGQQSSVRSLLVRLVPRSASTAGCQASDCGHREMVAGMVWKVFLPRKI